MAIAIGLATVTLVAFWGVWDFQFIDVYDDDGYVMNNEHLQLGLGLAGLRWAMTSLQMANWHPLTWLSYQLDYRLFGLDAGGFHTTNLLLHVANVCLLFCVLCRLSGAPLPSAAVAALFAVHPLHVESVAWISERKDVLSTFFWLLTIAAYLRWVRQPRAANYLLLCATFAIGLMAKPMLVTLPFVLLLLDYWPLHRLTLLSVDRPTDGGELLVARRSDRAVLLSRISEKSALLVLSAAACAMTLFAQRAGKAMTSLDTLPFADRLANAAVAYVGYLRLTFWPFHLAPIYSYQTTHLLDPKVVGSLALLVTVTGLVLHVRHRRPYLVVGWLWFLGTLVPVIGLVQVGEQAMADRYTYVPLIGIFVMLAWGAADFEAWLHQRHRWATSALVIGALLLLVSLVAITRSQLGHWHDSVSLWRYTAQVSPPSSAIALRFGKALMLHGHVTEAIDELQKSVSADPNNVKVRYGLGLALLSAKRNAEAIQAIEEVLRLEPNHSEAERALALNCVYEGNPAAAILHMRRVLNVDQADFEMHHFLALELEKVGQHDEAAHHFSEEMRLIKLQIEPQ